MHLNHIFQISKFQDHIKEGYVNIQNSIDNNLFIACYTPKTVYSQNWNEVTLNCRGLIFDKDFHLVARGMPKFFNVQEYEKIPNWILEGQFSIHEKLDGSLGICYIDPVFKMPFIATKGSFNSYQARAANRILDTKYPNWNPEDHEFFTYLFEIIAPATTVVVDYGGLEDLVYLGRVSNLTGSFDPDPKKSNWPGPKAITYSLNEKIHYSTILEKYKDSSSNGKDKEGFVLVSSTKTNMAKIKYEEYLILHRIVSNINNRSIWAALQSGQTKLEILEYIPDEFYSEVSNIIDSYIEQAKELEEKTIHTTKEVLDKLNDNWSRKDFAEVVMKDYREYSSLLFTCLDGDKEKLYNDIWKRLRPDEIIKLSNKESINNELRVNP